MSSTPDAFCIYHVRDYLVCVRQKSGFLYTQAAQLGMFKVRIHQTLVIITVTNDLTEKLVVVFLSIDFVLLLVCVSVAVETVFFWVSEE